MVCFVSALTVRFLTRRFIGEYDESLGKCLNNTRGGEAGWGHIQPHYIIRKKLLFLLSYFLEMTYTHHMNLDGQYVALAIMDTAGEVSKCN